MFICRVESLDKAISSDRRSDGGQDTAHQEWASIRVRPHLIFASIFSTKEAVTEVSGRGIGMDAVKSMVEEVGERVELELAFSDPSDIKPKIVIKF